MRVWDAVRQNLHGSPLGPAVRRSRQSLRLRQRRSTQLRDARAAIERLAPHLMPGPWVAVLRRAHGSKGEKLRYLAHASVDPRSLVVNSLRVEERFAIRRVPVTTVRSGHSPTPPTSFRGEVLLLRKRGMLTIAFDLDGRKVLRLSDSGFPEEYRQVRDAFSRHVRSVPYELHSGGFGIVEPLLDGPSLRQVPADTAATRVCELLEQLPHLLAEASDISSEQYLASAIDACAPTTEVARERSAILAWLGPSPLVPAHGDLQLFNVLDDGDGPICIDFGDTAFQPAWRDVLKLGHQFFLRFELPGSGANSARVERALEAALRATTAAPFPSDWRRLSTLTARTVIGRREVSEGLLVHPSSWSR